MVDHFYLRPTTPPDLHSLWDSGLISQRLRTLPWNYTQPLPLPEVEIFLRDTIYDPYIRRVVWEGVLGTWQDELDAWLSCPESSASAHRRPQPASIWQSVLSFLSSTVGSGNVVGAGVGEGESGGGLGVDDDTLCPYAWAKSIHQLNCEIVFPEELDKVYASRVFQPETNDHDEEELGEGCNCDDAHDDVTAFKRKKTHYLELDTPEYAGVIKERWIIEKLLTQGGVRLAAVLNWIFAELDEGEIKRRHLSL